MKIKYINHIFIFFLFIYFIVVSILSLNTGISHDEPHHFNVWLTNKKIYSNLLLGTNYEIVFRDFGENFYGIGFQIFSIPFALLSEFILSNLNYLSANELIIKHPAIVFLFSISGFYFKQIIKLITNDEIFSFISAVFYLMYPYLLGHSLFNTLDIPFMSVWLICTFFIMKISYLFFENFQINYKDVVLLGLLTGFLLSIRISGILIILEYIIFFLVTYNVTKYSISLFLKKNYKNIILFFVISLITFYLFHPNYWDNPLKIIDAIKFMGNHIQTVCTITLGDCMKAQSLPSSYIPIWFFFKLPIIILVGIFMFPLIEKKIFSNKLNVILLGSLSLSIFSILFLLILLNVNLYDEIRHLLFLIPIIFIISFSFLYSISKRLFQSIIAIFIFFFIFQNIKIFPYNYLWLNNFSSFTNINSSFEKDYWGLSTRRISNYFNENSLGNECIISNRNKSIEEFVENKNACFLNFRKLHQNNKRPFYVVLVERALRKGLPNNCKNIHNEIININFSKQDIIVAKIFKCT